MMDIVYIFKHSKHDDFELRYSLRSVAKNCPWVRKVWIYGDKPSFISDDKSKIEHVPGGTGALFKLLYEASQIPGLSEEFYMFADDYIVMQEFVPGTCYYLECLDRAYEGKNVRMNSWMMQLRKTWVFMKNAGIKPRLNYEAHVPTYFKKQWIQEAYKPQLSGSNAWDGLMGITYILNLAKQKHNLKIACVAFDRAGYIGGSPADIDTKHCTFLFFDNLGLTENLKKFIKQSFSDKCIYEI